MSVGKPKPSPWAAWARSLANRHRVISQRRATLWMEWLKPQGILQRVRQQISVRTISPHYHLSIRPQLSEPHVVSTQFRRIPAVSMTLAGVSSARDSGIRRMEEGSVTVAHKTLHIRTQKTLRRVTDRAQESLRRITIKTQESLRRVTSTYQQQRLEQQLVQKVVVKRNIEVFPSPLPAQKMVLHQTRRDIPGPLPAEKTVTRNRNQNRAEEQMLPLASTSVKVDQIADEVMRKLDNRIRAYKERMGTLF